MRARRGSVLILTLFVLTVLSLTAVSFAYRTALEHRTAGQRVVQARLQLQVQSLLAIALAALSENKNEFDHRGEPWCSHAPVSGYLPEWSADGVDGQAEYMADYHVTDEESKLHLLHALSAALENLGLSREQIDAVFDWIDEDDSPLPEGAESGYYLRLPSPYRARNARIEMIEELLQVRGASEAAFFGEDANGNRRLDPEEDDGASSPPLDDADGRLRLGWVDVLTCLGSGKINLNTAPAEVLRTLPISDEAVERILAFRHWDESSRGTLEEHVFKSADDIDALQGLSDEDRVVLKAVGVFKSEFYRVFITSRHRPTGTAAQAMAVVQLTQQGARVLQWRPRVVTP